MKYRELVESRSDGRPRPVSERAAVQGLLHSAACASCGSVDLCVYAWETDHFYCSQECRSKDVAPRAAEDGGYGPPDVAPDVVDELPTTAHKGRKKK